MKRKPIKIDWDALEDAFNNQNDELVYYLDLVTGHVVLEGEGEEADFDDEDGRYESAPGESQTPRSDTTRLYVSPPDNAQKILWMGVFVDQDSRIDPDLSDRIKEVLVDDEPAEEIAEILREHPEERDRWFLFRSDRLHEIIEDWLESHQVEAIEPPPWGS